MIKVMIVQPSLRHYRIPLFERLIKDPRFDITLHISPEKCDRSALSNDLANRVYGYELLTYWNSKAFWQKGIRLSHRLGVGDLLIISGNPRYLSNVPLLLQARRRGVKILWWGHGWTAGASQITAMIRRHIMRKMDGIILYTRREAEEYIGRGFNSERVFFTNNAIDQAPIERARALWDNNRLARFRATNNLKGNRLLLFSGRLTEKTNLFLVISALHTLNNGGNAYTLCVIGDGPKRKELIKFARNLGVNNAIIWLGAEFNQDALAPWFLSSLVFVYPGAVGLSLLHAFGYGLPVITHNNLSNQMPEIAALRDGVNGLLFEEGSVQDMVRKIRLLNEEHKLRDRLGKNALKTVQIEYSMSGMVNRFSEAIVHTSQMS